MNIEQARAALKNQILVGTSNIHHRGGELLYATGYLKAERKRFFFFGTGVFLFRDKWGENEVVQLASKFKFAS